MATPYCTHYNFNNNDKKCQLLSARLNKTEAIYTEDDSKLCGFIGKINKLFLNT